MRGTRWICNGFKLTKHQEPCNCKPLFSPLSISPITSQLTHQSLIILRYPRMIRMYRSKETAILLQRGKVYVIPRKSFEYTPINGARQVCISHHTSYFGSCTPKVSRVITPIGAIIRYPLHIYWTLYTRSLRHSDDQHKRIRNTNYTHIIITQQAVAYYLSIIHLRPKLILAFLRLFSRETTQE